jgi:HAD superfamily phosphatase (TIGR01668 family)
LLELFAPDLISDQVTAISATDLCQRGIRGVLIDLDNTLCENYADRLDPAVIEWAGALRTAGIALCVVSNGSPTRTGRLAAALDAPFVAKARKPLRRGVRRALALLGLPPDQAALVGDQIFTDVWGGNRLGLLTILVRPISAHESPWVAIKRPLERWLLARIQARVPPRPLGEGWGEGTGEGQTGS